MTIPRVLVLDDKENFRALFKRIAPPTMEVVCAADGLRGLELLATEPFDVVVSDVRMPGADGITLLRRIRDARLDVEVVLMTAYGNVADAVAAMKLGAAEYLTKPFDPDEAVRAIEAAIARKRTRQGGGLLPPMQLIGASEPMRAVMTWVDRASASDAPALLTGESGTGKELVARTIHARSTRSQHAFVAVNCGAMTVDNIDGELFGWVRGAVHHTLVSKASVFEEARGGTLYLDEVDTLPRLVQMKLARVLESRVARRLGGDADVAVDVRVVAAADRDVSAGLLRGELLPELFDRLNVLTIELPPLRDRKDDIPLLAEAFVRRTARTEAPRIAPDALEALSSFAWPGNVRQLESVIATAVAATTGDEIAVDSLPLEIRSGGHVSLQPSPPLASLPYREALALQRERATREYLIALLRDVQGNVTQAAERAGIERESFHRLMKRHAVRAEDYRPK